MRLRGLIIVHHIAGGALPYRHLRGEPIDARAVAQADEHLVVIAVVERFERRGCHGHQA